MRRLRQWIRLKGLAAFVVLLIVFFGLWYVFVDSFIKYSIEKLGTRAVGAKVDLDRANLALFPLGISLYGLKVTNPDKPMENAVDIGKISFSVDTPNLFIHRLIIDTMELENVRLATPRKTSGAISRHKKAQRTTGIKAKKATTPGLIAMGLLRPPDIKQILKNENLETTRLIKSIKSDLAEKKRLWQQKVKSLPSKKKIEEYRKRIKKIQLSMKKGDINNILQGLQDVQSLKKDINHDISTTRKTLRDFDMDYSRLKSRTMELNRAVSRDALRLSKKYSLSPKGLTHITQALLGPEVSTWAARSIKWYKRISPLLVRSKKYANGTELVKPIRMRGIDVHFREKNPLPDFLIKKAALSISTKAGSIKGKIQDITPDQDILGRPLVFSFKGSQLKGIDYVNINGELNHVSPTNSVDSIKFSIKGYRVSEMSISHNKNLPIVVKRGLIDLNGNLSLKNGKGLEADVISRLRSARIETTGVRHASLLESTISSALSGIQGFWIKITLKGTLDDYKASITSNLDSVLASSIRNVVAKQTALLKRRLYSAILNSTQAQTQEINGGLKDLLGARTIITQRMGELASILSNMPQSDSNKGIGFPFQR